MRERSSLRNQLFGISGVTNEITIAMKESRFILAVIVVLLQAQISFAQQFCPAVKFDVAPCFTDPGATSGFKFIADFKISPNILAGLGLGEGAFGLAESEYVGAEKEMDAAYEIFADVKWLPNSQRKVSFLLSGELGYVWGKKWDFTYQIKGWDGDVIDRLGPTATIAPGIDIALKHGGSIQITAEWRWQQASVCYKWYDGIKKRSETLIGLGIAYQWGNRR